MRFLAEFDSCVPCPCVACSHAPSQSMPYDLVCLVTANAGSANTHAVFAVFGMTTEATIVLRVGNIEEWQSHFFSKPSASRCTTNRISGRIWDHSIPTAKLMTEHPCYQKIANYRSVPALMEHPRYPRGRTSYGRGSARRHHDDGGCHAAGRPEFHDRNRTVPVVNG